MKRNLFPVLIALLFIEGRAIAQAVEVYAGHKRAGVDLLWFKNFKNKQEERTPFLFFSRNRASVAYQDSPTAFGSTNAVSYNFKNGIGIVAVGSFLNAGFTPKIGLQYFKQKGDFMFFGWAVADFEKESNIDVFALLRCTPKIKTHLNGFGQLEFFPVYNPSSEVWNITQRLRLGLKYHTWAAGFMADFNQTGKNTFMATHNLGIFLRNEF
ncbi:MAG: hypothetical protein MUE30_16900 [Spirosomaceae bacterium]|jgi:hypothetical protein|nr:hypothetical protein [Spirosomataceae bacterium]